jgi:XRE family transcriptional regulator, regulator of sulfur utilization
MISRRDILIATITACVTACGIVLAQSQTPLMKSSVFDWEKIPVKETKTGSSRDFFRAPTATLDQLECHVTTVKAGEASHAPHSHAEEELIIVKEGFVESSQNGVSKKLGPGSIIFEASNEPHGLRNAGNTPVTYYVIKWYSPGALKQKSVAE